MYLPRCSRMPSHSEGWKCSSVTVIRMPSQISSLALEVSTACDKVLRQRGPSLAHFPVSSLDSCHFQWLVTLAACVVTFPRLLFFYLGFLAMGISPAQKSVVSLLINPKVAQKFLIAEEKWGFQGHSLFWQASFLHGLSFSCTFSLFFEYVIKDALRTNCVFWVCLGRAHEVIVNKLSHQIPNVKTPLEISASYTWSAIISRSVLLSVAQRWLCQCVSQMIISVISAKHNTNGQSKWDAVTSAVATVLLWFPHLKAGPTPTQHIFQTDGHTHLLHCLFEMPII